MQNLTEHKKLCKEVKDKARKRFDGFIEVAEFAVESYNNKSIALELLSYLKSVRDGKMLEETK